MSTFDDLPPEVDQDEALRFHLIRAEEHLYRATQVVYASGNPIRKWWYRVRLLRAHSITIQLYNKEVRDQDHKIRY